MAVNETDEDSVVAVTAANLRGLAHPLRVRALNWLRRHGPATATQLATHLGQSSGATSYHLRQLAAYGFVVELPEHGNGRERWWQAAHRSTRFNLPASELRADDTMLTFGAEYLRGVARMYADRLLRFSDELETVSSDENWGDAFTLSDWSLTLTPDQAKQLIATLDELGERFRNEGAVPDGTARAVALQIQVFPTEPG